MFDILLNTKIHKTQDTIHHSPTYYGLLYRTLTWLAARAVLYTRKSEK